MSVSTASAAHRSAYSGRRCLRRTSSNVRSAKNPPIAQITAAICRFIGIPFHGRADFSVFSISRRVKIGFATTSTRTARTTFSM